MNKNTKIHRLNIYLTNQDRKILNEIKEKYHISYSTIAKVLFSVLWKGTVRQEDNNTFIVWCDHYLYKDDKSTKTSIKPRLENIDQCLKSFLNGTNGGATLTFTNMIKAFTRKELGKWTGWDEKEVNKRTSQIYNQFQQEYDPNWNGNEFIHRTVKIFKNNPSYWRKILGEDEQ